MYFNNFIKQQISLVNQLTFRNEKFTLVWWMENRFSKSSMFEKSLAEFCSVFLRAVML